MTPAIVVGALLAADRSARDHGLPAIDTSAPLESCTVSLVLVGADDSILSRMIDRATGRGGFSHVYVDPCRTVNGKPRVIDYTVARGVHWASPNIYRKRRRVRLELDAATGAELWGCVRSRIGRPFRMLPMAIAGGSAASCVGLVVSCMPGWLRTELEARRVGPCISPNTLAAFAGIG
jgi:hypothetical protein